MSAPGAKLSVFAGPRFACIRIVGRANFVSGTELKTLTNELLARGVAYFVLELSECVLMDSTFLGILAGFGLKLEKAQEQGGRCAIELLNPNTRIKELLEDLGVIHLFYLNTGSPALAPGRATGKSRGAEPDPSGNYPILSGSPRNIDGDQSPECRQVQRRGGVPGRGFEEAAGGRRLI